MYLFNKLQIKETYTHLVSKIVFLLPYFSYQIWLNLLKQHIVFILTINTIMEYKKISFNQKKTVQYLNIFNRESYHLFFLVVYQVIKMNLISINTFYIYFQGYTITLKCLKKYFVLTMYTDCQSCEVITIHLQHVL